MKMFKTVFFFAILFVAAGCSTSFENVPLADSQTNTERRSIDTTDKNRPVILVAISGGGVRAANLGWVILSELKKLQYTSHGQPRNLLDDVGVISSASGGSVIAAYFGLYGAERLPQFEQDFLIPDNMKTLGEEATNPTSWYRLAISGASRIGLVEEMFDRQLFQHNTLADLNQPNKPFIILNTTDMASGEVFAITPNRFNDICSEFDQLPIATGVAASAAVPIVLTPVSFQNYATTHCADRPVPRWISLALEDRYAPYINIEEYKRARYANDLRRGPDRFRDIQYLYLVDGGLAGNLGINSLLDAVSSLNSTGSILRQINAGDIKKLVVLVINARSDIPNTIYQSPDRPGIAQMVGSVASVPIDSTTASTNSQMRDLLTELKSASENAPKDAKFGGLKVYNIQVDMDQLRGTDPDQKTLRDKAKSIPTSWTISTENRVIIQQTGQLLLKQHPCFQKLLLDMKIEAAFLDRKYARTGCPQ